MNGFSIFSSLCSTGGPRPYWLLTVQKTCSVLGLLTSSWLFLRCSSKFSARTKEKWIWCFGLKRFCACPAKCWAGWLGSLNNVAWDRHCKRQSTRANTERCSICPMNKEVPKFNQWGEKEVLLLCEAYNAPVNVRRPCLTTLRLPIFQGLWYLLLTLGLPSFLWVGRGTFFSQSMGNEFNMSEHRRSENKFS